MTDTYPQNTAGEQLTFLFGDGGSPENFTSSCSINTQRKLDLKSSIYTNELANCTSPGKPSKTIRRVKSTDVQFTGAGVADAASFQALFLLWQNGTQFDGHVLQNVVGALGWSISGPWVIEQISLTGQTHEDQTFDITISIADAFTFTAGN